MPGTASGCVLRKQTIGAPRLPLANSVAPSLSICRSSRRFLAHAITGGSAIARSSRNSRTRCGNSRMIPASSSKTGSRSRSGQNSKGARRTHRLHSGCGTWAEAIAALANRPQQPEHPWAGSPPEPAGRSRLLRGCLARRLLEVSSHSFGSSNPRRLDRFDGLNADRPFLGWRFG